MAGPVMGNAQRWQRACTWANRATQALHTGVLGHVWQTKHRLGSWIRMGSIYLPNPAMNQNLPPTLDPKAATRWAWCAPAQSPWLHEEVARRMSERLQWIKLQPQTWAHWEAVRGGLAGHGLVENQYPKARSHVVELSPAHQALARMKLGDPWWNPSRWGDKATVFGVPAPDSMQMLWSNMSLHMQKDPQALIRHWHQILAKDGFLMFSCLGPDTLKELRALYAAMGWPAPAHDLTDMHDLGDMLVEAGFAEPVMDVERIALTYETPARLLAELRELGRNLHINRFAGLRTPRWRARLEEVLPSMGAGSAMSLSFEVIYGHAVKPAPRVAVEKESAVSLDTMRSMLRQGR
jgi:malonyl-CoA O-methyltransferase